MKMPQEIDDYAKNLRREVQHAVHGGSQAKIERRLASLFGDFPQANDLRRAAGQLKQHTLEHLDEYLEQAEQALQARGVKVHYAWDGDAVRDLTLGIFKERGVTSVTKSKSMVTEEVELREFLEDEGMEVLETDLGEYILQLDHDHPSHVVTPIVHKNRREIARTFEAHGLGEYNDEPEVITQRARKRLRNGYLEAQGVITGANFVSAESGRIVLVTNEGNSRFALAGAKTHIAVIGIEKLVPTDADLGLYLQLLARSATGQTLTVYTEFINGPRHESQQEGPEEMHVIFVNNNRLEALDSDCSSILRCIRCGACMNVCPVYRQASGHAYRSVYPGPVGAVLSPLLAGKEGFGALADLPKASSLCGACNEVCPVDIPIPDLLLRLRNRGKQEGAKKASRGTPNMAAWAVMAQYPSVWKTALRAGKLMNLVPQSLMAVGPAKGWLQSRTLPQWEGGSFRSWLKEKEREKQEGVER